MTIPIPSLAARLRVLLSRETTGGVLVICAAGFGLVLANSPARDGFGHLAGSSLGSLTVDQWAQDGLLALFFLTVGLDLIQEIRVGGLRDPRRAAVPILAACGGVAAPALVYCAVVAPVSGAQFVHGWAIPTATDIAFALTVLVLAGRGLPDGLQRGLRIFLLTLAVVDDLIGILVIAIFYSHAIALPALLAAAACVAVFGWLARRRRMAWWLMVPVAVLAWWFMYRSGVHATIAGVALGLVVPAVRRPDETVSRATRTSQLVQPFSNAVALPVFALFAAGVPVLGTGRSGGSGPFSHPVLWAVVAALVIGKPLGVLAVTAGLKRWSRLELPEGVTIRDLLPVALLCGIGFTVAMLIAGLSFDAQPPDGGDLVDQARIGVLAGSLISALLGGVMLHHDSRRG
ncbi:Na+/H+ antiporter NhaA [Acidipropionibacterium thoenii]|uniref:Na+/H+ antiporter NhaA n=1 Tax=Acidipropionibacterium thoenii TaxID=1751 RepID=UPI000422A06D|nr:Na+/H+ antiporter NhaA [Acidipropionibacterium thoenii]